MTWKLISAAVLGIVLTGPVFAEAEKTPQAIEENVSPVKSIQVSNALKNHDKSAPYLLVSCMDYRLRENVAKYMELRVGTNSYDEFVIPGASLGAFNEKYPHWAKTFKDTIGLAIKLHNISHVIFLDHRDCGFYKMLKGENCCEDKAVETHVHAEQFEAVRKIMKEEYPDVSVETLIMGLDGKVEAVNPESAQS
jgi:carbonic anhydrase